MSQTSGAADRVAPPGGGPRTYAALFSLPGVRLVSASALIARLHLGMMPLALILVTRASGRSYGDAGAVVAVYTATTALAVAYLARIVDVQGQRPVLLRCAVGFPISLTLTWLLLALDGPFALVLAGAVAAGALVPPTSSCVRVLWPRLVPPELVHSAFALEAVLQELVFISGPLLVVLAVHVASPDAAVALAAATASVGSAVFASTRASRATMNRPEEPASVRQRPSPALVAVLLFDGAMGVAWGAIQVAMPAFADHVDSSAHGGLALAALSVGSLIGGLVSGAFRRAEPRRWLLVSGVLVGLSLAPPLVAGSEQAMVALMLLAGLPIAPALASVYALVSRLATTGRGTETYAWLTTAATGGVGIGLFATGAMIEHGGVRAGLWSLLGAGALCAVAACVAYRTSAVRPVTT